MGRKEIRHKQLLQLILDRGLIPPTKELSLHFGVSERTIQCDLKEIGEQIPKVAVEDIRRKVMLQLRNEVPKMKVHHLIRLAEFFLAKQMRIESKSEVKVDVGNEIRETLRKYNAVIEEVAELEAGVSEENGS